MIFSVSRGRRYFGVVNLAVAATVLAFLAIPAKARKERKKPREELMNVLLGPTLAPWLIGAVSEIATDEEIQAYLRLSDDQKANEFIDDFWRKRRDPERAWLGKQMRDLFDARAEQADRLFAEGTQIGQRTDRGVIHVLFGEPSKRSYVQEHGGRRRTIEIWTYDREAVRGLNGARPKAKYYFAKEGGVTMATRPPNRLRRVPQSRIP